MSFLDGRPPRVIAHRGLALDVPENTLLAFARALSARATHLETDIHASADGVAVIAHDPTLSRVAGREVPIAQLTMSELRRIDLGHGQGFCTLAEALDTFPEARFNIDVKDARAAAPAVDAIRAARAVDRVLITSFVPARRRAVTDQLPDVATSPAVSEFLPVLTGAKLGVAPLLRHSLRGFAAVQIPERRGPLQLVTRRTVDRIHAAGAEVHVWTVNDPGDMVRLLDLGVDGIVTDRCDVLRRVVDARR